MSVLELLEKLKSMYPNKLPTLNEFNDRAILVAIGRQEIIRFIERLTERSD